MIPIVTVETAHALVADRFNETPDKIADRIQRDNPVLAQAIVLLADVKGQNPLIAMLTLMTLLYRQQDVDQMNSRFVVKE
jgi:hypothetical protein